MSYEIKFGTRATKQIKKLDFYIKEIVKEKLRNALTLNPYRYPLLSGKYSDVRRIAFSTPAGQFILFEKIKRELLFFLQDQEKIFIRNCKDT